MNDLITLVEIAAWDPSRNNRLTYPRQFDNAIWAKSQVTVTSDAVAGIDNQVLADKLVDSATTNFHAISQFATGFTIGQSVWCSVLAKQAGRSKLRFQSDASAGTGTANFDLATGSVAAIGGITAEARMIAYGNGWYRCAARFVPTANGALGLKLLLGTTSYGNSYAGDGVSGIHLDFALLEVGTDLLDPFDNGATAGAGTRTLRYGTHAFVTGAADVPPHVVCDPRIQAAPNFARTAFSDLRVTGGGSVGEGVLELANADQALAPLLDLGLDGRDIVVRVGRKNAAYPAGFTTQLVGTIEQPEIGSTRALLRLRDRLAVLKAPLQPTKYAGTNVLPSGAEGVPEDIKGQPKPDLWGRCYQVPLVTVNTARLIYQARGGTMQAFDAVYDQGVALTASGTDRANLAAMEATAPAAGQYDTCLALGLVRLGSTPAGRVTADARGDASGGYVDRVGAIVQRILTARCGVPIAQIDTASFAALDAAAPYEVGIWIGSETTRQAAIDALLASVGAWLSPDRTGQWQVGQLVAPAGTAVLTLTDTEILDLDRLATADPDRGIPVWQVNLRYKRYWAILARSDLAGGVTEARKAELVQEWRTVTASDATVQATHLLAPTLEVETLLVSATDAATERDRRLALHKLRRDYVRVRVPLTPITAALNLGGIVDVITPALGYGAGRKFTCLGIARQDEVVDLDLWG